MASALDSVAAQMPVANAKRQKQNQAAADFQLQQAVASAPAAAPVTPALSSQLGAASATNLGTAKVDAAKQQVGQSTQLGQAGLQQQQSDLAGRIAGLRQGVAATELGNEKDLSVLDADVKKQLFDDRMEFERDKMGREFMTDRQIQDYMVTHAQDVEQFKQYEQDSNQLSDRKTQAMQTSLAKITQELEFQNTLDIKNRDQAQVLRLEQAKLDLARSLENQKAEAAARRAKLTSATAIVGRVVGAVVGGPAGAAVGYQAGGAAGGMMADA